MVSSGWQYSAENKAIFDGFCKKYDRFPKFKLFFMVFCGRQNLNNFWNLMFLIGPISAMAKILSGFALMQRLMMMYPKSFPWGISKAHFSGFNLMLNRQRFLKVFSKSKMRLHLFWDFITMSST
jgi:hypothetical protein